MGRAPLDISFRALLALGLLATPAALRAAAPPDKVEFNRHVRPLLSDRCYACHGPDANRRKADLRLDLREAAFRERRGRVSIVPGSPERSELFLRISTDDSRKRMPPAKSGKSLSPEEVEIIRRWIQDGAEWQAHWSYLRPARLGTGPAGASAWEKTPVDRFILEKLEKSGLAPSPEADRVTLVRRLSFDLLGLPPAPEEAAAFQADSGPGAYERLVERLLSSPHYGERMALHWLDLVRYADTTGIHGDNHRNVSPYRDYVIRAFNENKPFDRFTIEQLGGDLLPEPGLEEKVASGYNRMLMTSNEGGAQPKEYYAKYAADRVRNASSVWLGATIGCAECHDHKFDPFTTRDFYRFAAFFADLHEPVPAEPGPPFAVPSPAEAARLAALDGELAAVKRELESDSPELAAAQARWESEARAASAAIESGWAPQRPHEAVSSGEVLLDVQDDLSLLASGSDAEKAAYLVTLRPDREKLTALRLEALADARFAGGGLSRSQGNFVLSELEVDVRAAGAQDRSPVKIEKAIADYSQDKFPIEHAIDGKPDTGWAVDGQTKPESRTAVFLLAEPAAAGAGAELRVRLRHESRFGRHTIGRLRLSVSSVDPAALRLAMALPADLRRALSSDPANVSPEGKAAVAKHHRSITTLLDPARKRQAELKAKRDEIDARVPRTLVAMASEPRTMRVLPRGNWLNESGEVVEPGVPGFLRQIENGGRRSTRLDLARWLVAPDNPLTGRVFVNRLWQLFFGQGIARTVDDLGAQGAWPTHPELLDWLAVEFQESGWDVKHLVKIIVLSATYRQTSQGSRGLRDRDPYNELLARQGRFRLDAEFVRDNALAVSGLLVPTVGGPSVKPYQPALYWSHLNFPTREYQADHGESLYRRGLYTYWCRTFLHPSLLSFDAPTREECTARRVRSNTPLQALVLLNDPIYVEAARAFAERIVRSGGATFAERLRWAYRRALSREPNPDEEKVLEELHRSHLADYRADKKAADELVGIGEQPHALDLDAAEQAAWTSVARALLNLHEAVTRS